QGGLPTLDRAVAVGDDQVVLTSKQIVAVVRGREARRACLTGQTESLKVRSEPEHPDDRVCGDGQRSPRVLTQVLQPLAQELQGHTHRLIEPVAALGDLKPFAIPDEQRLSDPFLELAYALADGRLRNIELGRAPGEATHAMGGFEEN